MTTFEITALVLLVLILGLVAVDLVVDLRETKPIRRRKQLVELGAWAAEVAEQRGGTSDEKARYARELVLLWGRRVGATPVEAEHVVEAGVVSRKTKG